MTQTIPAWRDGRLQPIEKLRVHSEGLRHLAISVFANSGDLTLIQRRADGKYHTPGRWANACCTHPARGEAPEDCAHRRVREELGLTVAALRHRRQVTYRADVGGGLMEHEVVEIFATELPDSGRTSPRPRGGLGYPLDRLERPGQRDRGGAESFVPWLRIYLADHRTLLTG